MEKIRRAVLIAAGQGKRLRPLTEATPKPLIDVNGVRFIDSIIQSLEQNGIYEIYVVTGHLREQFLPLAEQHKSLHLLNNPFYQETNNISSIYIAREYLEEAFILECDLMVRNPRILTPYVDVSGYCATSEHKLGEWMLTLDGQNRILACDPKGEQGDRRLFGISRWTQNDGATLRRLIELEFEKKCNRSIYWDEVALFLHREEFSLRAYLIDVADIQEIDTLEELAKEDKRYTEYLGERNSF